MPRTTTPPSQPLAESIAAARRLLLRQARRILRNRDDAEDVAQDALLAALSNMHRYRGEAQLESWLYRVGANAGLMAIRRQRRATVRTARALFMLPAESNWLHGAAHAAPPLLKLEQALDEQLLYRAIAKLPLRYRAVIMQCELAERPVPAVAESLGLSRAGVRTRQLRALHLLRTQLKSLESGKRRRKL